MYMKHEATHIARQLSFMGMPTCWQGQIMTLAAVGSTRSHLHVHSTTVMPVQVDQVSMLV